MDIRVMAGGIQATEDDLIVINLFEGVDKPEGATGAVDQAMSGAIRELIADGAEVTFRADCSGHHCQCECCSRRVASHPSLQYRSKPYP